MNNQQLSQSIAVDDKQNQNIQPILHKCNQIMFLQEECELNFSNLMMANCYLILIFHFYFSFIKFQVAI